MKPTLERIEPGFGSSFSIKRFERQFYFCDPKWHFHPEFEIVFINRGHGKRQIGNHLSHYYNGDLIMIGPNLPHFGFTQEQQKGHYEIVVQMKPEILGESLLKSPEMMDVRQLFERARTGLSFSGETKNSVGRKLVRLHKAHPFDRLLGLMDILNYMAKSEEVESLNANGFTINVSVEQEARIKHIYGFVQEHSQRHISLDEISSEANMTVPAFCRFFKRLTNQTFTQFVNQIRVAQASKMLIETDALISDIAHDSGFNNISHFNKHFLKVTGQRPSEYRKQSGKVLTVVG